MCCFTSGVRSFLLLKQYRRNVMSQFGGFLILLFMLQGSVFAGQKEVEYTGKLDAKLVADRPIITFKCLAVTADEKSKLLPFAAKDDQVFTSTVNWTNTKKPGNKLLL